ncbi:MAG: hypothetical protein WDW38_001788 [Sanguina aurantia]
MAQSSVAALEMDEDKYLGLLSKLIGETKLLQNNPPDSIPVEDRAVRHVLDVLTPFSEENGGPLNIQHVSFVEGRGNLIITYPGEPEGGILSFVGCHFDVVTANPQTWDFEPFSLTRDGDKLRGRGTTDCLGHVALIAELFRQLAEAKPKLKRTIVGVCIANEENSKQLGVGVDALVARGYLDHLKAGPLYWVDSADSQPCVGTGGVAAWSLTAFGKLFHSGLPDKAINPMELAMEACSHMQSRFYRDYPPHPEEARYKFSTSSTMKPTQWSAPGGSINQIPGECTICGDVRVTPFYDVSQVMARLRLYADELNADLSVLPCRGPASRYSLPDEGLSGRLELKFFDAFASGVACSMESEGFQAMVRAFTDTYGECKPFAITGSLPCIKEMQVAGYDVQVMGFGLTKTYHANNEYALLSDLKKGFQVMCKLVAFFG